MSNTEEPKSPDMGPFRKGRLLHRGIREAVPDANLIKSVELKQPVTAWERFRAWFLDKGLQWYTLYLLLFFTVGDVAYTYFPFYAPLIVGTFFFSFIGAMILSYEYEIHRDKDHMVFLDVWGVGANTSTISREMGEEGIERIVVKHPDTKRGLYIARDYQLTGEDPNKIELKHHQIVDTGFGKLIDLSYFDEHSKRIGIGDADEPVPSGMIFHMSFPTSSKYQMSTTIKELEKELKNNNIDHQTFMELKKRADELKSAVNSLYDFTVTKGIPVFDIDTFTKKQKAYFVALDKFSLPFWKDIEKYKDMDLGVKLPYILNLVEVAKNAKDVRVWMETLREQDKIEMLLSSLAIATQMVGVSEEAAKQFLVENRKQMVAVQSGTEKEVEADVSGREEKTDEE
ncbi:MAG: hypothetical protein ACYDDC_00865 [Thermoplasmataceae archaeon]